MTAATQVAGGKHPAADAGCFHCGLPLPARVFPVAAGGVDHATCCRGCQAVAQQILEGGLGAYYRNRTALAPPVPENLNTGDDFSVFDLPEIQRGFVRTGLQGASENEEKEAALLIEGMTCAACVWLVEQSLSRLPGVREVMLNYDTRRARVRWDECTIRLSQILAAVAALGYRAHPYDRGRAEAGLARERRMQLWRLFIAGFSMMQVMMYAIPVYIAEGAMTADIEQLLRIASLVLTLPVALWSALPFYTGAWRDLRAGRAGMDLPVSLGIVIAFAASLWATWTASGPVYFDSVAMFVFLLLGARYLEMQVRERAVQAQERLARVTPLTAERFLATDPERTEKIAAACLQPGDRVRVRPGDTVPADGVVISGISATDESLLTGESRSQTKRAGDTVIGGSVNLEGALELQVTRAGEDTALAGILRLLDRAQAEKPRIARMADQAARYFVAALLLTTVVAFVVWWFVEPSRALWVAVSLLVVTCPCALSLATPAALTAAAGAAYQSGVLVTRGTALEALARVTHVVFDKTGTLTTGRLSLMGVTLLSVETRAQCLAHAAALEAWSEHPAGRALTRAATGVHPVACQVRTVAGEGVEGIIGGRLMRIGRPAFVRALHGKPLPDFADADAAQAALGDEQGWMALFRFEDPLRQDARETVQALRSAGLRLAILSGDSPQRARQVAGELGVHEVVGGATPDSKLDYVRCLQAAGAVVAMVGDGVNDAPVLAQAQVSIALSSGTPLSQVSADIVLMGEGLSGLAQVQQLSRRTLCIIRQNLFWALAYNGIAVPLALAGMVTPLAAAAGMSASSLVVVLNALRLARAGR